MGSTGHSFHKRSGSQPDLASTHSVFDPAMSRDREIGLRQAEILKKTQEKEHKMFEKVIKNEESKSKKAEEQEARFAILR